MKTPNIQKVFQDYNQKYWKGKLPSVTIVFRNLGTAHGTTTFFDNQPCIIRLSRKDLTSKHWRVIRISLLHEMIHIEQGLESTDHGEKFQKRKRQLMRQGAYDNLL